MNYCEWPALTKGSRCKFGCGVTLKRDYEEPPRCTCTGRRAEPPKLGDQVEGLLASIGITKERYAEVKASFGLPSTCGCTDRQKALNDWGDKVSKWWQKLRPSG